MVMLKWFFSLLFFYTYLLWWQSSIANCRVLRQWIWNVHNGSFRVYVMMEIYTFMLTHQNRFIKVLILNEIIYFYTVFIIIRCYSVICFPFFKLVIHLSHYFLMTFTWCLKPIYLDHLYIFRSPIDHFFCGKILLFHWISCFDFLCWLRHYLKVLLPQELSYSE